MTGSPIQQRFNELRMLYRDPSALRSRVVRGITWSILGVLAAQGFKLLTTVIAARALGDVGYGELGVINSTIVTFGVFAGLGLGVTATKYVAQLHSTDPVEAGRIVGFLLLLAIGAGGLMMLLTIAFAPVLADRVLSAPHLSTELRMASVLLLFNAVNGVQLGALAGLESFRAIAILTVLEGTMHFLLVGGGAFLFGLAGAVAGYALVAFAQLLASQWVLRRRSAASGLRVSYSLGSPDWTILWTFAVPAVLISLSSQPFSWLSRIMLTSQENGYADLGVFNAAFSWTIVLLFLPRQILRPSVPILANLYGEGNKPQFDRLVRVNLRLVVGLSFLVAIFLSLLAPWIMRSYGEEFARGETVLVVILLAYAVASITLLFRDVMTAIGQMWWQVALTLLGGLVLVGSLDLFGKTALGLALSYLASFTVLAASQALFWVILRRREA